MQRRLAWPMRKDDTHKSRSVTNSACSVSQRALLLRRTRVVHREHCPSCLPHPPSLSLSRTQTDLKSHDPPGHGLSSCFPGPLRRRNALNKRPTPSFPDARLARHRLPPTRCFVSRFPFIAWNTADTRCSRGLILTIPQRCMYAPHACSTAAQSSVTR